MKVKILKKTIKEGDNYCIKSLFVSFTEEEIYKFRTAASTYFFLY